MSITSSTLTRAAGVSAVVAGLIYVVIQFIHPSDEVASVTTDAWVYVHSLSLVMAVLAMVGVTGIYLRQVKESGVLGLIGYVLFSLFFVLQAAFVFTEAFVAPLVAKEAPQVVESLVGLFAGGTAQTDLGPLAAAAPLGATFYIVGGAIFGVAVLRARVLSRWAAILMVAAAAVTPLAAVLPHDVERLLAIPVGVALAWLGYSLWSNQRKSDAHPVEGVESSRFNRTPAA